MIGGKHQVLFSNESAYTEYVQRMGAPVVKPCRVHLSGGHGWVWWCLTHEIGWDDHIKSLSGQTMDRCPIAGREEYRSRRWEAGAAA